MTSADGDGTRVQAALEEFRKALKVYPGEAGEGE